MAKGLQLADIALGILVVVGVLVVFALFGPVLRRGTRELGGTFGALAGGLAGDVAAGPMTGSVAGGGLGISGPTASPIANNPAVAAVGPAISPGPFKAPPLSSPASSPVVTGPPAPAPTLPQREASLRGLAASITAEGVAAGVTRPATFTQTDFAAVARRELEILRSRGLA